jgi:outer membrane murein-binding lipoprotein Lpp
MKGLFTDSPGSPQENTMKKLILCSGISFVLMALAGCSQNQLNQFQRQLSDVSTMISPGEQHPSEKEAERNEIAQAFQPASRRRYCCTTPEAALWFSF